MSAFGIPVGEGTASSEEPEETRTTGRRSRTQIIRDIEDPDVADKIRENITKIEGNVATAESARPGLSGIDAQRIAEIDRILGRNDPDNPIASVGPTDLISAPLTIAAGVTREVVDAIKGDGFSVSDIGETSVFGNDPQGFGSVSQAIFGDAGNRIGINLGTAIGIGDAELRDLPIIGAPLDFDITLNRSLGFLGDVALDPLNIFGGGGLVKGGKLVRRGVSRRTIARNIVERSSAKNGAEIARQVTLKGVASLTRKQLDEIKDVYQPGVTYKVPFLSQNTAKGRPISISQANVQALARPITDATATIRRGLDSTGLNRIGSRNAFDIRQAARIGDDAFVQALDAAGAARVGRSAFSRAINTVTRNTLDRLNPKGRLHQIDALVDNLIDSGKFPNTEAGIAQARKQAENTPLDQLPKSRFRTQSGDDMREFFRQWDRPQGAQKFIDAIESGQLAGTVEGLSISAFRRYTQEAAEFARENGIDLATIENYVPRVRDDIEEIIRSGAKNGKEFFEEQRKFAPGEFFLGEELTTGTLKEVQAVWDDFFKGAGITDAGSIRAIFAQNPAAIIERYNRSLARRIGRQEVLNDLAANGRIFSGRSMRVQEAINKEVADAMLNDITLGGGSANKVYDAIAQGLLRNVAPEDVLAHSVRKVVGERINGAILPERTLSSMQLNPWVDPADLWLRGRVAGIDMRTERKLVNDMLSLDSVDIRHAVHDPAKFRDMVARRAASETDQAVKDRYNAATQLMDLALANEGNMAGVHLATLSQEAALRAQLKKLGADNISDRGLVRQANAMANNPKAIANLKTGLNNAFDSLVSESWRTVDGTDLVAADTFAKVFADHTRIMEELPQIVRQFGKFTSFLKSQQTLSVGFTVRNLYSGIFAEVLAGHTVGDISRTLRDRARFDPNDRSSLPPERWEAMNRVIRLDVANQQTRLGDSLARGLDDSVNAQGGIQSTLPGTGIQAVPNAVGRATQIFGTAGQFLDEAIGGGTAFALSGGASRGRMPAEQLLREAHVYTELLSGNTLEGAVDSMYKFHFDYSNADLSKFEQGARIVIPYYTFMSRNLPLMMEMVARKPGAFNNLFLWQDQLQDRYGDELLTPDYFDKFIGFTTPDGDRVIKPDLQINDLIETFAEVTQGINFGPGQGRGPLGIVPQFDEDVLNIGPYRAVLNDTAPWFKIWQELADNKSSFSGAPIAPDGNVFQEPINPLGDVPGIGPYTDDILAPLAALTGGLVVERGEGEYLMDARLSYGLEQFIPILSRLRRLAPNDKRFEEKLTASWLGFLTGGYRDITDRDRRTGTYEVLGRTDRIVSRLKEQERIKSSSTSSSGRTRTRR